MYIGMQRVRNTHTVLKTENKTMLGKNLTTEKTVKTLLKPLTTTPLQLMKAGIISAGIGAGCGLASPVIGGLVAVAGGVLFAIEVYNALIGGKEHEQKGKNNTGKPEQCTLP